jgi:hypothetical protein
LTARLNASDSKNPQKYIELKEETPEQFRVFLSYSEGFTEQLAGQSIVCERVVQKNT